jgi:histone acetyltransferase 1
MQREAANAAWTPPGELLDSYELCDKHFEIWQGRLAEPRVKLMLQRMQIFIPFFIEGGTYINLDMPEWSLSRWRIYFLYVFPLNFSFFSFAV